MDPDYAREAVALVSGRGRYTDDNSPPNLLYAGILRSPYPHAVIRKIDLGGALAISSVKGTLTGEQVAAVSRPIPSFSIPPGVSVPLRYALAFKKVRYQGEPVAAIVAEDRYAAEDALDEIAVDYEPLEPVVDPEGAVSSTVKLHDNVERNIYYHKETSSGDVAEAFEKAHTVVTRRFRIGRLAGVPLEPRSALASFNPDGTLTVCTATQVPHILRIVLSEVLSLPKEKVRVTAGNVGGSFGTYKYLPEEFVVSLLSMRTGRPVKWTGTRTEMFLSGYHSRDQVHYASMAFDKRGRILGLRDRIIADMGAYLTREGVGPPSITAQMIMPYDVRNVSVDLYCVATNKTVSSAFRGIGRPEAAFVSERLLDMGAKELKVDPAEMRFRNLLKPGQLPYVSPSGIAYDSGDYPGSLRMALKMAGYKRFRSRKQTPRGVCRKGIGISMFLETNGSPASPGAASRQTINDGLRIKFDSSGRASVYTGLMANGQGHVEMVLRLLKQLLGVEPRDVEVVCGDTNVTPYGPGTFASRSAPVASGAAFKAAEQIRAKALRIVARALKVDEGQIEFRRGVFFVRRRPRERLALRDVARMAFDVACLPEGVEPGLDVTVEYMQALMVSYGANVSIVEVDTETGSVRVWKYFTVHDCGRVINPAMVEGQVVGGAAQGLGGSLLESIVYNEEAQLLTTNLADYVVPSSLSMPAFGLSHMETATPNNPLGVKGVGEGGIIGSYACIANAIEDALEEFGVKITEVPMLSQNLWAAVRSSG